MTPLMRKGLNAALVMTAGCVFMGCLEIKSDGAEGKDGDRVLFRFGDPRAELWGYNKKKKKPFPDHESIRWSSDRGDDMSYGNGKARIKIGRLRPGDHKVKAKAKKGDKKVDDDIKIRINNDKPVVSIASPLDGGQLNVAASMTFRGSATDREDDAFLGGVKTFSWQIDGPTSRSASGKAMPVSGLPPGTYRATLTATDQAGASAKATRTFYVRNSGPEGTITGPATIKVGSSVTLTGEMFDMDSTSAPKDPNTGMPLPVAVPASKLTWYRSWGGTALGTGASLTLADLSSGSGASKSHSFKLVGTDEFGTKGEATFTVTVTNDLPSVTALEPAADAEFTVTQSEAGIRMRATVTDDHAIASVTWLANGIELANKGTDVTNVLGKGDHELKVRAVDAHGGTKTVTVGTITVLNQKPTISISTPDTDLYVNEAASVTFTAVVNDPDGFAIPDANVRWSSTHQTLTDSVGPSVTNSLQAGTHRIKCTVTDKHGDSETAEMIVVVTNRLPTVEVTSPSQSFQTQPIGVVGRGQGLRMRATVTDPDNFTIDDEKIVWTTEVDGETITLANKGADVRNVLPKLGLHKISCTVTDAHGGSKTSEESITVHVTNLPPQFTSISVKNDATGVSGTRFSSEKVVRFTANVTDPDGFEIEDAKVEWTDNGTLLDLTGKTIKTSDLKVTGDRTRHLITCTVTDAHGATETKSVRVLITNSAPDRVRMIQPNADVTLEEGQTLALRGGGRDPEDGRLEGESIRWLLQKEGESLRKKVRTGRAPQEPLKNLAPGTYTLTLRVVDNDERALETSRKITVKANQAPVVTIVSPASGPVENGTELVFTGRANDPETGPVAINLLSWTYQKRTGPGPNGLGPAKKLGDIVNGELKKTLPHGRYRITLTAKDPRNAALKGTATIRVFVKEPTQPQPPTPTPTNELPVVTISAPGAGGTFRRQQEVTFTGSATDDGAAVAGNLLKWTVQRRQGQGPGSANNPFEAAKPLGSGQGASVKVKFQRPGHYRVTLTVVDNADPAKSSTATVDFRVRRGPPNGNAGGLVNGVNNN